MSLFYFDTCQVSPISRYVLLLLRKTSQNKFIHAEPRWFHLNSYFGHGCGVEKWRNAAAMTVLEKEGTGRREGLIPLQMEGEGKSFPEQGYFLLMEF